MVSHHFPYYLMLFESKGCKYVYIYIYTHTYIYTYIYIYINTKIQIYGIYIYFLSGYPSKNRNPFSLGSRRAHAPEFPQNQASFGVGLRGANLRKKVLSSATRWVSILYICCICRYMYVHTYIHTYITYIYIHIYMYVYICVCICMHIYIYIIHV